MFQPLNLQWILWILPALLLAFIGYFILYPLKVIALFSVFFKKKRKVRNDILAVPVKFRVRIWFDKNATDKSSLVNEIKKSLKKLAESHNEVSISQGNQSGVSSENNENTKASYIPGDDQLSENKDIKINDGPEIKDENVTDKNDESTAGYIRLRDL